MIHDKELGLITFKQSLRAKRMSVRILSNSLQVSLPRGYKEKDGLKFIDEIREKLLQRQKNVSENSIILTEGKTLTTLTFDVHIQKSTRNTIFASLKSGILNIDYPQELKLEASQTQTYCWKAISYFLRKEAKITLPKRTQILAEHHGFSFTDVKIQSSKTRWGSCNRKKNINLSFYLMLLPEYLADYVILHELCHTREMNHSSRFWEWLDHVTDGKAKTLRNELKKYNIPKFG